MKALQNFTHGITMELLGYRHEDVLPLARVDFEKLDAQKDLPVETRRKKAEYRASITFEFNTIASDGAEGIVRAEAARRFLTFLYGEVIDGLMEVRFAVKQGDREAAIKATERILEVIDPVASQIGRRP